MRVWLAYVNYPITTAVYIRRALLHAGHLVTTIGPRLPEEAITMWGLENMKLPLDRLDIDTDFTPDMARIWNATPADERPDLYLWVESVNSHLPQNLDYIYCPKACYLIDTHYHLTTSIEIARNFDYVFIAQLIDLESLRGAHPRTYWLPLACDPEIHRRHNVPKLHDVGFVGGMNPRRQNILGFLGHNASIYHERSFWHDMSRTFSASKIVLNDASFDDLNMRFFEALASGSLLLSNYTNASGQEIMFRDGEDYACHSYSNLTELVRHYLTNNLLREQIAEQGYMRVHAAHRYHHRIEDMLNVIFNNKKDTFSPLELRERSLVPASPISTSALKTCGDISILTSPDSVLNIGTISPTATTIPIDIAIRQSNHEFILLAEPGFAATPELLLQLKEPLLGNTTIACTSPAGRFVNPALLKDQMVICGSKINDVVSVDAPMPVPLLIRRSLWLSCNILLTDGFYSSRLHSYNIGQQIRSNGLTCCVVPCQNTYDVNLEAVCLEAPTEAELVIFRQRWNGHDNGTTTILSSSNWYSFATAQTERHLADGRLTDAFQLLDMLYENATTLVALHDWSIALGKRYRHAASYIDKLYRLQWLFGSQIQ